MEYYVSKVHDNLNGRVFSPEDVTSKLCLNPKYRISLKRPPEEMQFILDSGAFQDIKANQRLTFQSALNRQLNFESRTGFVSTYLVSYDQIVDESPTVQGIRKKRRVNFDVAERYVQETIDAAKFLADQRRELKPRRLVLSNQGVTPEQYLDCMKEILSFSEPEDIIGLGGFCIVGQIPRYAKDYYKVVDKALPLLKSRGIKRLHLFGMGVFKILIKTHVMCHEYGITPSYDTSSPEFNAVFGRVFTPDTESLGPEGVHLTNVFNREDKYILYHPRDWALLNIELVSIFWEKLNSLYPIPQ